MTKKTEDLAPWEDTLILAFRDLQWLRKQEKNAEELEKIFRTKENWKFSEYLERIKTTLQNPPPLLAKLDGHAESASGDVLTAQDDRFFLLEFKSSFEKFRQEKDKYIKKIMDFVIADSGRYDRFRELSVNGHFLVYPTFSNGSCGSSGPLLPIHEATLRSAPYYEVCSLATTKSKVKPEDRRPLKDVIWKDELGLTIEQMAAYLYALSQNHGDASDGHPMKVVVASANGMVWPIADLSQLMKLQTYFSSQSTYSNNRFDDLVKQIKPLVQDYKASLSAPAVKPKSDVPDNGKRKRDRPTLGQS